MHPLTLTTLASGSSGNCTLISQGDTHILIDAGISCRRITTALKQLGIDPKSLAGIFITHEHSDHVSGLATLTKQLARPVYTSPGTGRALCGKLPALVPHLRPCLPGEDCLVGSLQVTGFPVLHDAIQPMGFSVTDGVKKVAFATDLGVVTQEVTQAIAGADILLLEANHDVDWVREGPYPYYLQDRILGTHGHLSNEASGAVACSSVQQGTHTVILAHLSSEHNSPVHAKERVRQALCQQGISEDGLTLVVAPRGELGVTYSA